MNCIFLFFDGGVIVVWAHMNVGGYRSRRLVTTSKKSIFIDKKTFFLCRSVCGDDESVYDVEGQKEEA